MSAIISECGRYRYRLERRQDKTGPVVAFFGVNPSTADASAEDATTRKWHGFAERNGWGRYIVGNVFALRSTDVRALGVRGALPIGQDNTHHLLGICADADILVPCWGDSGKIPKRLRSHVQTTIRILENTGKPMFTFGLTKGGDPRHPLMLGYNTPIVPWAGGDRAG